MSRSFSSISMPRSLVLGGALLTLPVVAVAQETATVQAASTHDGQSRDEPPTDPFVAPTTDLDDSDATADGVTYDNWWIATPDRSSSDYVRFDVYRAVIRGHGQAEDADVSSATTESGDAWGQDLVSITAPAGTAEAEFVEVVNQIEVIQSWNMDPGDGNTITAHAYAVDIHNNRHHWELNVRTDGAKSQAESNSESAQIEYDARSGTGAQVGGGGGFVGGNFTPIGADASAEGASHHGSESTVDLSSGLLNLRTAGSGEMGSFEDGFTTTIRASGGWSGRIASESNAYLKAHAIIDGTQTVVVLNTFDTINHVEGWAHYRLPCGPQSPEGEGGGEDGPQTPGGEGGGPETPGGDEGGPETPGGGGDDGPVPDQPPSPPTTPPTPPPPPPPPPGADDDAPAPELEDDPGGEEPSAPPAADGDGQSLEDAPAGGDDGDDAPPPPSPAPTGEGAEPGGGNPGGDVTPPGADDGTTGTNHLGGGPNTGTGVD